MITGKTPYISTVSLLNRPVPTTVAGTGAATSTAGTSDSSTVPGSVAPVPSVDKLRLSESAASLIDSASPEVDEARAARIQELKQAVEEKRYHVESRKIAERLLQEASELMATLTGYPIDPMAESEPENPMLRVKQFPDRQAEDGDTSSSHPGSHPASGSKAQPT